ncbi:MAG: trypsin-like peptidase domain-containing protein, partial [Candidatus Hodarchaeota archaeon]
MKEFNSSEFWYEALFVAGATVTGGPVGAGLAFLTWEAISEIWQKKRKGYKLADFGEEAALIFYFIASLAKLAKLDGRISVPESSRIKSMLGKEYKLDKDEAYKVYKMFWKIADDKEDFEFYVKHYAELINFDYNQSYTFITSLIAYAHVDNDFNAVKQKAIKKAIKILRLSNDIYNQILYNEIYAKKMKELKVSEFGSGYFINDSGFVITNDHVIGERKNIKVRSYENFHDAEIIHRDKVLDLCLLKIDDSSIGTQFYVGPKVQGRSIFTYGYPLLIIQGFSPKLTMGVISSNTGLMDNATTMQIDAAIQPGNSGGPVIDCKTGSVIGTVCSILKKKSQNVNYAIKTDWVLSFLEKINIVRRSIKTISDFKGSFERIIENVN